MELKLPDYSSVGLIGLIFLLNLIVQKMLAYWRLRHFKGPPGTGWTDFFHSKEMIRPRLHDWYESVTEKYGKTPPKIISWVAFLPRDLTFAKDASPGSRRMFSLPLLLRSGLM